MRIVNLTPHALNLMPEGPDGPTQWWSMSSVGERFSSKHNQGRGPTPPPIQTRRARIMENEIIRRLEDGLVAAEDEVDLLKVRRQVQEAVWMGRLHKKEAERILKAIDYKLDQIRSKSVRRCYRCKEELSERDATAIANVVDKLCNNVEGLEQVFSDVLDLIHCVGDEDEFLEDGRVVICLWCFIDGLKAYLERGQNHESY